MALYKLSDGTSSVDFSPVRGLNIPETRIRQLIETKEGKPDSYEWGDAEKYEIPLINIKKTQADILLDWWENMDVLTFTPDQGAPATTIQMIIDGIERPINMWHHEFKSKYAGMAVLCEVSSQSFSSSHVSVSKSQSCSSKSDSESCSTGSSVSASDYFLGLSVSESQGVDAVSVNISSASCSRSSESSRILNVSCSTWSSSVQDALITLSSCSDSVSVSVTESCSDSISISRSSSAGRISVIFTSHSNSLDPSEISCSDSVQPESCSVSAGGIS